MATILLVDDTDFDRKVAAHLLLGLNGAETITSSSGEEALALLTHYDIDLVVTDVQMPGMTGLELLHRIRAERPHVPVLIVTSHGSESLAVQALREGAASYIPKSNLQRDLVGTVEAVLESAFRSRSHAQLMQCLTHQQQTFEIPNQNSLVPQIVGTIQESLARLGVCDEAERIRIGIALEEALVNAIIHGNLEVGSDLRERADDSYTQLIDLRKRQKPYCDRRVQVTLRADRDEATILIRDQGPGFDISKLPDPTDPENLCKCSGRGILLMRSFFDEVIFNDLGNQVTMVRRRRKAVATHESSLSRPHRRVLETVGVGGT